MIPLNQTIFHDPDNKIYGDCQRACIASILEIPIFAFLTYSGIKS